MKLKTLVGVSSCPELSDLNVQKLKSVNIQTVEQLITHFDLDGLSKRAMVSIKDLKSIKKFIIGHYSPIYQPGHHLIEAYTRKLFIIETGCRQIDDAIMNGVYSSEITEINGLSSTGKTQICFNLIVNMLISNQNFTCLYIDSCNNFCVKRICDLFKCKFDNSLSSQYHNNQIEEMLKAIKVINCKNIFNLLDILFNIKKTSTSSSQALINKVDDVSNSSPFIEAPNLLIIDDLKSLFDGLFRSNSYLDINFHLSYIASHLKYLAESMNMAIIVNTYTSNTNNNGNLFDGSLWKCVPNLIVHLKNQNGCGNENRSRRFEIIKCNRPYFNEANVLTSCNFGINEYGLI